MVGEVDDLMRDSIFDNGLLTTSIAETIPTEKNGENDGIQLDAQAKSCSELSDSSAR